jgi:hypothetical protein
MDKQVENRFLILRVEGTMRRYDYVPLFQVLSGENSPMNEDPYEGVDLGHPI